MDKLIHIVIKIFMGFLCVILLMPSLVMALGVLVGKQFIKLRGHKRTQSA